MMTGITWATILFVLSHVFVVMLLTYLIDAVRDFFFAEEHYLTGDGRGRFSRRATLSANVYGKGVVFDYILQVEEKCYETAILVLLSIEMDAVSQARGIDTPVCVIDSEHYVLITMLTLQMCFGTSRRFGMSLWWSTKRLRHHEGNAGDGVQFFDACYDVFQLERLGVDFICWDVLVFIGIVGEPNQPWWVDVDPQWVVCFMLVKEMENWRHGWGCTSMLHKGQLGVVSVKQA